jgi:hypothetical protein
MVKPTTPPKKLYKYRSMDSDSRDFTESIFRKNQVWYAQASTFNDPFDCDHFIDIDRSTDEWREIMEHFEERFSQIALLGPGLLLQGFWNKFVEGHNEKARAESRRELPKLTREKLLEFTKQVGKRSQLTIGGRNPAAIVDDGNNGQQQLNHMLSQYFDQSRKAIDEKFGVYSLAERDDNILMWSHYADDHTGICIEFDTGAHPGSFPNLHAVVYTQESPVIEKRFANILMNLRDKEDALDDLFLARIANQDVDAEWTDRDIRSWFLTKSILWKYENEWRSIVTCPGLKRVPAAAISGIIIGCNASEHTEQTVREWVKRRRRKVSISRAVKKEGAFALDIDPVNLLS